MLQGSVSYCGTIQIAHFATPMAHVWNDVVHACQQQRIFCNDTCLNLYLAEHSPTTPASDSTSPPCGTWHGTGTKADSTADTNDANPPPRQPTSPPSASPDHSGTRRAHTRHRERRTARTGLKRAVGCATPCKPCTRRSHPLPLTNRRPLRIVAYAPGTGQGSRALERLDSHFHVQLDSGWTFALRIGHQT